jgi:transposase-like protein
MGRPISALNGPTLTPRQEAVALALASGLSVQETARQAGVGATTVKRWLRGTALVQRIRELRAALTSQAAGLLAEAMSDAARTLRQLCLQSDAEHIRLKAAEALLTHGGQMNGLKELEARLNEYEASLPKKRLA